jgi:4-alpha-glucanotransferase
MATLQRSCGLLLHLTSLPGTCGIGTLGPEARRFCDLLVLGGQRCWQILPCGPVTPYTGYSPYASPSTFAGNDLLISLELLAACHWCPVSAADLPRSDEDFVDFDAVCRFKRPLLAQAETYFFAAACDDELQSYENFCREQAAWLDDYVLFAALSEFFETSSWITWPKPIAERSVQAMGEWQCRLEARLRYHRFVQYLFFTQWHALKRYCNDRGVLLIGDIPIYVTFESADAWANPGIFECDPDSGTPARVSGVPPDYFSATGQRWGNPLYRWHDSQGRLHPDTLAWWGARIGHHSVMVDMLRIDHFRGFESYWAIPAASPTAVDGEWVSGPGRAFFDHLFGALEQARLIAEDLGIITPAVEELRAAAGLPGMKVLQFAFDGDSRNTHLPHTYQDAGCIVYTGTHDNNTTNGWFYGAEIDDAARTRVMDYIGTSDFSDFHWSMIRLAMQSIAFLAMIPVQDVLGFGEELRMNRPGTLDGRNWAWKLRTNALGETHMQRLSRLAALYGRLPDDIGAA